MGPYDPPRVRLADATTPALSTSAVVGALGIPWLICLGTLYFITPVLAEAFALSVSWPASALVADLALDTLFVALATWWAITLSRLAPFPVALLFALMLVAVNVAQSGGLPGIVYTGLPSWYAWAGNVNDLVGALLAAAVHKTLHSKEHTP